ncbi:MAG: response regulator [Methanolobus sp.]
MVQSEKPRILIVDDEPMNIELLQAYLQYDYEVIPAYSGREALELVASRKPDIVLLDLMMPGVNGYKVCDEIKSSEDTKYIPIVLVTALSSREDRLKGIEVKADDFLSKPVDRLELKMRVKSLLRIKQLQDNLVKERDQAQNYLDVAAVMMMVMDLDFSISLINKRGLEILGYEEDEVLGKNFLDFVIPEELRSEMEGKMSETLADVKGNINYSECPVITKGKEQRIVSWYCKPLKNDLGSVVGILCSGQDITKRKIAEESLKTHTKAMEASIDGMAIMDQDGIYLHVNKAHARIFGYESRMNSLENPGIYFMQSQNSKYYQLKLFLNYFLKENGKESCPERKKTEPVFFRKFLYCHG